MNMHTASGAEKQIIYHCDSPNAISDCQSSFTSSQSVIKYHHTLNISLHCVLFGTVDNSPVFVRHPAWCVLH